MPISNPMKYNIALWWQLQSITASISTRNSCEGCRTTSDHQSTPQINVFESHVFITNPTLKPAAALRREDSDKVGLLCNKVHEFIAKKKKDWAESSVVEMLIPASSQWLPVKSSLRMQSWVQCCSYFYLSWRKTTFAVSNSIHKHLADFSTGRLGSVLVRSTRGVFSSEQMEVLS